MVKMRFVYRVRIETSVYLKWSVRPHTALHYAMIEHEGEKGKSSVYNIRIERVCSAQEYSRREEAGLSGVPSY
jgi:hypothetical protein